MKLNVHPLSSRLFTYNEKTKTFVGESSELSGQYLSRLYDDACDVGLCIVSHTTGKQVTYYMDKEYTKGTVWDEEITHWTYLPTSESLRQVPDCKGTSVTVFND